MRSLLRVVKSFFALNILLVGVSFAQGSHSLDFNNPKINEFTKCCLVNINKFDEKVTRQLIGQMLLVGFQGNEVSSRGFQSVLKFVKSGKVGGVLFLRNNIKNRDEIIEMTSALRLAQPKGHPVLIAIDQEGGYVQRLTKDNSRIAYTNSAELLAEKGAKVAKAQYDALAEQLSSLGFNFNLGPVVDLNTNPDNPIIGKLKRSYSNDPNVVVQFANLFIDAHRNRGILTSLKHFPGHGSSATDSHKSFVDISKSWTKTELSPFQRLIDAGAADAVMIGHLYNQQLDPSNSASPAPATLSPKLIRTLLRDEMGFTNVVISDDMQMAAITDFHLKYDAMIRAIFAGNDILIYSNIRSEVSLDGMIEKILQFAREQPEFSEIIRASSKRIASMKKGLSELTTQSVNGSPNSVEVEKWTDVESQEYVISHTVSSRPWRPEFPLLLSRNIRGLSAKK